LVEMDIVKLTIFGHYKTLKMKFIPCRVVVSARAVEDVAAKMTVIE